MATKPPTSNLGLSCFKPSNWAVKGMSWGPHQQASENPSNKRELHDSKFCAWKSKHAKSHQAKSPTWIWCGMSSRTGCWAKNAGFLPRWLVECMGEDCSKPTEHNYGWQKWVTMNNFWKSSSQRQRGTLNVLSVNDFEPWTLDPVIDSDLTQFHLQVNHRLAAMVNVAPMSVHPNWYVTVIIQQKYCQLLILYSIIYPS